MDNKANQRRILILEDDGDYRKLLLNWISSQLPDVEIVEYDPKRQGVPGQDFNWSPFNVLILDYNLNLDNSSGLDILQANYSSDMFPCTILLTGSGSEEVAVRAFKYEVSDYLRKEWMNKDILKVAVENAFIQNTLKHQRLNIVDEIQQRVEQESERISKDLKVKYARVLELEKKQLRREREEIEKELEIKQALLEKMEHEWDQAEIRKYELKAEVEKLQIRKQASANDPEIKLELETTLQRLERTRAEMALIEQNYEHVKAFEDKNRWKQDQEVALDLMVKDDMALLDEDEEEARAKERLGANDWIAELKKRKTG